MNKKKMEEFKISVIMSCYNSEKTVILAIESVISQTHKNWELIIVDDCSTDNSVTTINTIKDSRVKLFQHNTNLGCGWARRTGIANLTGEYTMFLDSDDTLPKDAMDNLLKAAIENDADLTTGGYTSINNDTKINKIPTADICEGITKFKVDKSDSLRFLWTHLIKSTMWETVSYSPERFIEDTPTLVCLLHIANKRVIIDKSVYNYYQYDNSLIHSSSKLKNYVYECLCVIKCKKFIGDSYPMQIVMQKLLQLATYNGKDKKTEYINERKRILEYLKEIL